MFLTVKLANAMNNATQGTFKHIPIYDEKEKKLIWCRVCVSCKYLNSGSYGTFYVILSVPAPKSTLGLSVVFVFHTYSSLSPPDSRNIDFCNADDFLPCIIRPPPPLNLLEILKILKKYLVNLDFPRRLTALQFEKQVFLG